MAIGSSRTAVSTIKSSSLRPSVSSLLSSYCCSTPPIRGAKVSMKKSYPMPGLREFESRWRLLLWRTFLLTPFKLITVFLHEASHAIAWLNNMLYFLPRE
ncbi:hypothetical protein CK203_048136 [Vitis vinifera]|uniref:Uncharacterized protein n=1 Tax=Vitis vinifera TaxID=29760 RepID=A0A438HJE4_VITVI|nr:hypothetical protein CK203_048136 [Vitis vinifera]